MKSALALVLLAATTASLGCGGGAASFQASKPPAVVCNPPNMLVGGVCTTPTPAPTASLSVNPGTISKGESTTLTWQTTNATDVSIDVLGTVQASGSQSITPASSTTYTLTAKGAGGTKTATATITVTAPPPVVPAHYQVFDLVPLPGATGSQANAVSNGRATGYSSFWSGSGTTRVTVWQSDGTPRDLGVDGKGQGINSQGEVVGYIGDTTPQAFLWNQGVITQLGALPGFDSSIATAINDAGEVVGIAYVFANPNNEVGFKWTRQTGMFAIAGAATASGINNNGDVAAMTQNLQAAIFTASGTITLLGTLGDFSLAGAVNNQGHACGMSSLVAGGPAHSFFYNGTAMQDIGTLQAGSVTVAPSMNDSDLIVGVSNLAGHALPYVWSATTGMEDLNTLISPDSGWQLATASGVDAIGEIVGAGGINGAIHGFMLTPD